MCEKMNKLCLGFYKGTPEFIHPVEARAGGDGRTSRLEIVIRRESLSEGKKTKGRSVNKSSSSSKHHSQAIHRAGGRGYSKAARPTLADQPP